MKNNLKNTLNAKKSTNKRAMAVLIVCIVILAAAITASFFNIPWIPSATENTESAGASFSKSPSTSLCTDTDGGMNPFLKGTCTGTNGQYTDVCNSNISVKEYYCSSNNTCESVIGNCTWYGNISTGRCKDGMCELKPQFSAEINALMLSVISGAKIQEGVLIDVNNLNVQPLPGKSTLDDTIIGAYCRCAGCPDEISGCGGTPYDQCFLTACSCPTRQGQTVDSSCYGRLRFGSMWLF